MDIKDILIKGRYIKSSTLKEILYREGYKENKCEICGISEWHGKPIVCHLHHIDGDNTNNTLENLQILCPNCHSQTDTYCGSKNKMVHNKTCKRCGKPITKDATYCSKCIHIVSRKVPRPSLEDLKIDLKNLKSFRKVGKKYGVSDKAIRKWFKGYNYDPRKKSS